MQTPKIKGFHTAPTLNAGGKVYRGRFTCAEVQWTGVGADAFATFTITAAELADACESRILWTDQSVQRGIRPGLETKARRELTLADGYPDESTYIFDSQNADEMVEKLLAGERLFLNPLIWNMRPGHFTAYFDAEEREVYIYDGKVYLPDSHHRHQAILRAVRLWRESPRSYPNFDGDKQFKVELYFLNREDEGNYFFDKNQRPRPTAKSKAYDLTTADDLSLLAKRVAELSPSLVGNINRVTDRLSSNLPHVMTLSTLREMMRTFAAVEHIDSAELEGLAVVAAEFYEMLAKVRPELGHVDALSRATLRLSSIAEAAVTMHGYAALMKEYQADIATKGRREAGEWWRGHLLNIQRGIEVSYQGWQGDLFDKANPLWLEIGVTKSGARGKLTVNNTGGARAAISRVLKALVRLEELPDDIAGIV